MEIDARGLPCPQPVLLAKKKLESIKSGIIEVVVDNKPASENVSRFAKSLGCKIEVKQKGRDYVVKITKLKGVKSTIIPDNNKTPASSNTVFFIPSDAIGRGDDTLGRALMGAFFATLTDLSPKPKKLMFMNGGVKLVTEGSTYLENLSILEKQGVEILACGTCLEFFNLKNKIKVGRISNFFEISENLLSADKVITL